MIDGVNRIVLLCTGAGLAAAGGFGLAANQGAIDDLRSPSRIYTDVRDEVVAEPDLWFAVVVGAGALVFGLALFWLVRQFTSRPGGPHLGTEVLDAGRRGRTSFEPVGLARAVARDFEAQRAVRDAKVRLLAVGEEPRLHARLVVDRDADADDVLARTAPVLERAASSLGARRVDARIRIDFASRTGARVV